MGQNARLNLVTCVPVWNVSRVTEDQMVNTGLTKLGVEVITCASKEKRRYTRVLQGTHLTGTHADQHRPVPAHAMITVAQD